IAESAIAVVMIEGVGAVSGYVNVLESIVVIIPHRHSHVVVILRHSTDTGFFRDIGESAVGVLTVEPVPELWIGFVGQLAIRHGIVDFGAIGKEDVQPSVVVVIKKSDTSSHRLDQVLITGCRVLLLKLDFSSFGDISELHLLNWRGSQCAREHDAGRDCGPNLRSVPHGWPKALQLMASPFWRHALRPPFDFYQGARLEARRNRPLSAASLANAMADFDFSAASSSEPQKRRKFSFYRLLESRFVSGHAWSWR